MFGGVRRTALGLPLSPFGDKFHGDDELIDSEPGKSQVINKGWARIGVAEKRRVRGPDEEGDDARHVVGIFCPVLESAAWMT